MQSARILKLVLALEQEKELNVLENVGPPAHAHAVDAIIHDMLYLICKLNKLTLNKM